MVLHSGEKLAHNSDFSRYMQVPLAQVAAAEAATKPKASMGLSDPSERVTNTALKKRQKRR